MQVMILEEDPVLCRALAAVLRGQGLDVLAFTDIAPAREAGRQAILDLLVLGERIGGRLAHDVALLAEWRNPGLGLVLLSDREGEEREELFDLLPALRAVLPTAAGAAEVAQVALAVARSQSQGTTPALPRWRDLPEPSPAGRVPQGSTSPVGRPRIPPAERARPAKASERVRHAQAEPAIAGAATSPTPAAMPPGPPRRPGQLPPFLRAGPPARSPAPPAQPPASGRTGPPRSAGPPRRLHLT